MPFCAFLLLAAAFACRHAAQAGTCANPHCRFLYQGCAALDGSDDEISAAFESSTASSVQAERALPEAYLQMRRLDTELYRLEKAFAASDSDSFDRQISVLADFADGVAAYARNTSHMHGPGIWNVYAFAIGRVELSCARMLFQQEITLDGARKVRRALESIVRIPGDAPAASRALAAAKRFASIVSVAVRIEEYKALHGKYPASLADLSDGNGTDATDCGEMRYVSSGNGWRLDAGDGRNGCHSPDDVYIPDISANPTLDMNFNELRKLLSEGKTLRFGRVTCFVDHESGGGTNSIHEIQIKLQPCLRGE